MRLQASPSVASAAAQEVQILVREMVHGGQQWRQDAPRQVVTTAGFSEEQDAFDDRLRLACDQVEAAREEQRCAEQLLNKARERMQAAVTFQTDTIRQHVLDN